METNYQKIIEIIQYYCLIKDFDSLQAIIQLLSHHDFEIAETQQLLGDALFSHNIHDSKKAYTKAAHLYEKSGKRIEAEAISLHLQNLPNIK